MTTRWRVAERPQRTHVDISSKSDTAQSTSTRGTRVSMPQRIFRDMVLTLRGRRTPSTDIELVFQRRADDERGSHFVRVRHGKVQCTHAGGASDFGCGRVQQHARSADVIGRHFDGTPRRRANADSKCLEHRFFRGKTRRESFGTSLGVSTFALGKESFRETRVAFERQGKTRDVHEINANVPRRHYSTVTVLAKLRGRSMFRPSPRAMA